MDFISFWLHLFDTSDFPARWHCGRWTAGHGWLHVLSDFGVWSAYFAIPAILAFFILRRRDLPFRMIFLLFGAFILFCGATHLMEAVIFWWPAYRLAGVIKFLTAVVSWTTVIALVQVVPSVLRMRSPEELEREIAARQAAEQALQEVNADLEQRVAQRTAELAAANESLRADREWFRTTLGSIGDAVITTDTEGQVITLNPVAEALTGWSQQEAAGQPLLAVFEIVHEKTREPVENPALRALAQGTIVGLANHTLLLAKDGVERFIDDSAAPIKNEEGETTGAVLVFRDISERYHAERELRESEARFLQLADAIPNLAWMARADGHIDWYNSRWYEYTGATWESMQGWGWQSTHDPTMLPQVMERWTASLATGEPFEMVFPLRGADGLYRTFLTRVMPFRDEQGRIQRWFGTNTDISEQQRTQEELRQIASQLSDADRRKDEFLATLAHELRNPLAPIRTGLEVMRLAKDDPQTLEDVRGMMERQTKQLITLVDDLLDVSRITRGKLELRKCPVNAADVLRSAVEASRPFIDEAGHHLAITLPESAIHLEADPHRLAQVISNLLNNAAKYTPEGGRIDLLVERQDDEVRITVRDNGVGIPTEMLERIFEMFAQIDRTMERTYTGLGIGLTLVRSLVEMHGGRIEVHSDGPNRGSEFSIFLPLLREASTAAETDGPEHAPVNRRVLVVDDNRAAAESLSLVVKMLGHEVQMANDGEQAVAIAAEFLPEIILMDLGMPRMNGYEAARRIRSAPWGDKILLVALTGWGQDHDKQKTAEAGFDHHLIKPAEPSELRRILAETKG